MAEKRLRALGVRTWRRGPGNELLTERERAIARLIAAGAEGDPEIAQELFLSRKTVERHISNLLKKVGVRNRAELAARVAELEVEGAPHDRERTPDLTSTPLSKRRERTVAMVVVLFPASDEEPTLRPAALEQLARLGVTNVALLRDGSTAGLVLEGWAFAVEAAPQAACAVAGACDDVRTLHPIAQGSAVSAAAKGGES